MRDEYTFQVADDINVSYSDAGTYMLPYEPVYVDTLIGVLKNAFTDDNLGQAEISFKYTAVKF